MVTLSISKEGKHEVFKNKVDLINSNWIQFSDVTDFEVIFRRHPSKDDLAIVLIIATLKTGEQKSKLLGFIIEEEDIVKGQPIEFD